MKKITRYLLLSMFSVLINFCQLHAQPLPGGGDGTGVGDPPAGAPIGDGLLILGILAALYAGKKIYELYLENKLENTEEDTTKN